MYLAKITKCYAGFPYYRSGIELYMLTGHDAGKVYCNTTLLPMIKKDNRNFHGDGNMLLMTRRSSSVPTKLLLTSSFILVWHAVM